ncbi:MAG: ribosome small subunit-dependent GTPase A [Clostridia bacterium]|nr:ribosome small subunit-dependent GTPase A [Clostridia bacterium]
MPEGILIRGIGSFYTTRTDDGGEFVLRAKKKFRRLGLTPMVGDRVRFTPGTGEEEGWVEEILPRRSAFVRPPVANVECLLIVLSPEPAPDWLLAERLLVECRRQEIDSVLVASKSDLDGGALAETMRRDYAAAEAPVFSVSARTGEGLEALREAMAGRLCCLAGQSGVGKSTLLSALTGLDLESGELSQKIARGKNTTRKAELLFAGDLRVFDTAGFSLLALSGRMEPETLRLYYPEFIEYEGQCRFDECLHDREPGCAVTAAVLEGRIAPVRQERYRQILAEVREAWNARFD